MKYWLLKTEPDCYSIDDLKKEKKTPWAGVRNFQARNFMRDDMQVGDMAFIYHSSTKDKGIYGLAKVASKPYPDKTAFDKGDEHYDAKYDKSDNPTWFLVDFAFVQKFEKPMLLGELKLDQKLEGMMVRERGSRLSIQPVSEKHFEYILKRLA